MSFDGIVTKSVTEELQTFIETGRITKIYQPYKHELIFHIRAHGKKQQLFVSANPSYARIHLTDESYENPAEPPMFCMLLRKHLEGSFIEKIEQIGLDRVIILHMKSKNEIGDFSYKRLIIELMGRHSNIILVDKEKNVILDSIKHITPAVNRHRTVLPGYEYIDPPAQSKVDPLTADKETILRKLDFNAGKLDRQIVDHFAGLSPLLAKEIVSMAGLANRSSLPEAFLSMMDQINRRDYKPQIIVNRDQKEIFHVLPLAHIKGDRKTYPTVSKMLDRFYYGKAERDRVKQQANDLERFIKNEVNKNKKKIKKLERTLDDAGKAEKYKLYGELLTANLYAVKRGDEKAEVINYYDENSSTITIPLDPQKTPSENAQHYFQKYQKAKNSVEVVQEQIKKAEEEIVYFDSLVQQVETASPRDINEIREELAEEGYLKARQQKQKGRKKDTKPTLEQYTASDGTTILVGKNNKQNEYLTNRIAARDDVWLHTKDIPGSHVVIRSKEPTEETILEAANLAAYFSKARTSSSVPVDYTKIRHVKKPSGAKPGFVIYDNQNTVFVTPDEDLVVNMRK